MALYEPQGIEVPEDFEPTHEAECGSTRHYVLLSPGNPVSWGYVPGSEEPAYAVTPTGIWQSLNHHGRVRAREIKYTAAYKALGSRQGFVYFIQADYQGPIKIGWSQDVQRRLKQLQTARLETLRILGTKPGVLGDESRLHRDLAAYRLGGEWFLPSPLVMSHVVVRR